MNCINIYQITLLIIRKDSECIILVVVLSNRKNITDICNWEIPYPQRTGILFCYHPECYVVIKSLILATALNICGTSKASEARPFLDGMI